MMAKTPLPSTPGRRGWARTVARYGWIVVLTTVLAGVFLLYWQPDMAFDVATKLWSCF
jgi:uncharacterized membrane protein YdfJ with MMPL/SSD domain